MLDASNHDAAGASTNKSKKSKMQVNRSTDRFWPNTITSGGANGAQPNDEGWNLHFPQEIILV